MAELVRRSLDPTKPVSLTKTELEIARLTVEGFISEAMALKGNHNCGWPLSLDDAAKAMGYKLKRVRTYLDLMPEFNAYRAQLLKGRRESESARNLATAVAIRDDPGDGRAADKTVQLKAIGVIEGKAGHPAVQVNVNQVSNVANITAGYVIRLGRFREPEAPSPLPLTIKHEP